MRNIFNNFKFSKLKIVIFTGLLITSLPLFSAEDKLAAASKSSLSNYKGITTATFESLSFYPKRSAPAKVEAINISKIAAEISAKIKQIKVKPGAVVKTGDTLAILECIDYEARLSTATAVLKQTQQQLIYEAKELKRAIKVAHKSSLSESEIERRQTAVNNLKFSIEANKANRDIAKQNVKRCTIEAPFNGLVSKRIANLGEMMAPGAPILELVQLNQSEVSATISISNLESFKNASSFEFIAQSKSYPLKLRTLLNFVANNSSSQNARFLFQGNPAVIGFTGRLEWQAPQLHLPAYLLSKRAGKNGVFVERDGVATFVEVMAVEEGRPFIVDLTKFDKVILDGRHAVQPFQKLNSKLPNNQSKE
jgi:RND family efflux transporter MFP subunit